MCSDYCYLGSPMTEEEIISISMRQSANLNSLLSRFVIRLDNLSLKVIVNVFSSAFFIKVCE